MEVLASATAPSGVASRDMPCLKVQFGTGSVTANPRARNQACVLAAVRTAEGHGQVHPGDISTGTNPNVVSGCRQLFTTQIMQPSRQHVTACRMGFGHVQTDTGSCVCARSRLHSPHGGVACAHTRLHTRGGGSGKEHGRESGGLDSSSLCWSLSPASMASGLGPMTF